MTTYLTDPCYLQIFPLVLDPKGISDAHSCQQSTPVVTKHFSTWTHYCWSCVGGQIKDQVIIKISQKAYVLQDFGEVRYNSLGST